MRNSVRYTMAVLLLAGAGAGGWWIWNGPPRAESTSVVAAGPGAKPVTIPRYVPPPFEGKPRTEVPAHRPVTDWPEIPAQPSDHEIALSRVFPRRLAALDGTGDAAADNTAMGEFLRRVREMDGGRKLAETETWLAAHPESRWAGSLRAEVADARYRRGWFAKAREGYHGLWNDFRTRHDPGARGLADEALGFLLENDMGTGRAGRLKELLAQSEDRPRAGSLEGKIFRAKQAVYLLEHVGAQNVMCGPMALNAIQRHQTGMVTPVSLNTVPASYIATGLPLSEVAKYAADHYKLPLTPAKRTDAAAAIPVPSVMHAQDEHYVALVQAEAGKYFMVDRARRFAAWVEAAAVDAMSSGNFLVPSGGSPAAGFVMLAENDARNVFGRDGAHGTEPTDEGSTEEDEKTDDPCDEGMPVYAFNAQLAGLIVNDTPLKYSVPFGPQVACELVYQDMDSSQPVTAPAYAHTGEIWLAGWMGYVEHLAGTPTASTELRVHDRHGGVYAMGYDVESGTFGPHHKSFAVAQKTGAVSYECVHPDGMKEIYSVPDNPAAPTRVFLSSLSDPSGNTVTFTYNAQLRLVSLTDALGQVTTLQYNHPTDPLAITSVTDPFSRTALLGYDVEGRLNSLTDQIGLTSTFVYQADGFMSSMTTPYGTTTFRKLDDIPGRYRTTEAEDPHGDIERIQFDDPGASISSIPPYKTITVGGETIRFYAEYNRLQYRNSYHWTKEAWHAAPGDPAAAVNYRWLTTVNWLITPVLEAIKPPLEERTWFSYPGMESTHGSQPYYPGMGAEPSMTLKMLDAHTPQLTQTHRNRLGRIIKSVDPLGRITERTFAANGVDMIEMRQTTGGISERLISLTYDTQRNVVSVIDASNQSITYTHNARGQVLTMTTPAGTMACTYDAGGCLIAADGPLPGPADTTTYTYDALCRLTGGTGTDGYTVSLSYDNMDRIIRRTWPDGSFEEITYNRLDATGYRDRAGRVTSAQYNALRQVVSVTDPLNRVTTFEWCRCGDVRSITDPMGRTTRLIYDLQGRLAAKEYPDGSRVTLDYQPGSGWLNSRTDDKGQIALFDYYLDGQRRSIAWPNAAVATPSSTFTYDTAYGRPATMTDGQGTTIYSYHPVTGLPATGARRLASIDGPWANDTITLAYDAADRLVSRSINGVAQTAVWDPASRLTGLTNALGTFTSTYVGATERLASLSLPGGGQSVLTYYPNSGDRRLQTIRHEAPGGGLISEFGHTWDVTGRLTNWTQMRGAAALETWAITGDAAGQTTGVTVTQPGSPIRVFAYEYDAAGNRTAEVIDGALMESEHNALNQQTHIGATAPAGTYEWDGADRLTAIVRGTRRSEFSYDGHGRRVRVVEKDGAAVLSDNRYLWCDDMLCEERSADGGTALRRFFNQGEQLVSSGAVTLYTRDHINSVREVTTTAGAVLQLFSYDPWGRQTATPASPAPSFSFAAMSHHGSSGLHLAVHRAYDPAAGRWISRDPLSGTAGRNLYAYVENRPFDYTDRLGLIPEVFYWYGNWGGPGWANGEYRPEAGYLPGPGDWNYKPPKNARDACYEGHDRCINACGPCPGEEQSECIRPCDYALSDCLWNLGFWDKAFTNVRIETLLFGTVIPWFVH